MDRVPIYLHATLFPDRSFRTSDRALQHSGGDIMADLKTKVNNAGVEDFLNRVGNAKRREDAFAILKMMKSVTRHPARMWGPARGF